ncbi:MAG: preprotein translocase subunit SecG [Synergistaceae bacterium]|nr:preprotein translocase subunit SecG [Synergistaceae bacterium]
MLIFLNIVHVLIAIALIVVIMMQKRNEGGFTGSFGGAFENSNAWKRMDGLAKLTAVLTAIFLLLSLIQALVR